MKNTNSTVTTPSILELVSTIVIPAITGKFVAKEKFVINTKDNAPVKIFYLDEGFTDLFLEGGGKIEDPIGEQTLRYYKLRQSLVDGQIITELGGEAKAEITLSEMFSLMEKYGEKSDFLKNDWNLFYIKDVAGVLQTVFMYWTCLGQSIHAGYRYKWNEGIQVFSRNSVPAYNSFGTGVPF